MSEQRLPINEENLRRLHEWAGSVQDQARRAIDANAPRMRAAFERFAEAMTATRPTHRDQHHDVAPATLHADAIPSHPWR